MPRKTETALHTAGSGTVQRVVDKPGTTSQSKWGGRMTSAARSLCRQLQCKQGPTFWSPTESLWSVARFISRLVSGYASSPLTVHAHVMLKTYADELLQTSRPLKQAICGVAVQCDVNFAVLSKRGYVRQLHVGTWRNCSIFVWHLNCKEKVTRPAMRMPQSQCACAFVSDKIVAARLPL